MIGENEETPAWEMIAIDLQNTEVGQLTLEQFKEFLINEVRLAAEEACKNIIKKLQNPNVELGGGTPLYHLTPEIPEKEQDDSKKEKILDSSLTFTKKRRDRYMQDKELKYSVKRAERLEPIKGIRRKEKKSIERRARHARKKNHKENKIELAKQKCRNLEMKYLEYKGARHLFVIIKKKVPQKTMLQNCRSDQRWERAAIVYYDSGSIDRYPVQQTLYSDCLHLVLGSKGGTGIVN
ncbi:UNVERIFIED_CONTAM: hypothetical protein K2H54_074329 [Gekko kuhli]